MDNEYIRIKNIKKYSNRNLTNARMNLNRELDNNHSDQIKSKAEIGLGALMMVTVAVCRLSQDPTVMQDALAYMPAFFEGLGLATKKGVDLARQIAVKANLVDELDCVEEELYERGFDLEDDGYANRY